MCFTCNEVVHKGCWDTEDAHQKVTNGQVEDEEVRDRSHLPVLQHNQTYQAISHHAQQEDEEVGRCQGGSHRQRVLVIWVVGDTGVVGNITVVCVSIQETAVQIECGKLLKNLHFC